MAKESKQELGTAELEVLKALWDLGASPVRDVMDKLHERGRKVAYTTVLTFLSRLEKKGYVRSDRSGLAYVYEATASREKIVGSRLKTTLSQLFDGAAGSMVVQLMQTEKFSSDEIAELQRVIDSLSAESEVDESEV